ncbi:DUF4198 domain-containing protein [Botrimarina hoheduenensis]|uniref:Nickel uptake substrate-specific transmembrane region n=1 Tax=Botrimarina hoheduenensis TaxID=2528000 RepID=A0A5C5VYB6_9BACT|nr:DUF4198 domain-containing protein [Botrimarina hoheduenensis]TWT42719.1 hypothetical protein Pla111_26920 [Botrimarina hoheduenensis]
MDCEIPTKHNLRRKLRSPSAAIKAAFWLVAVGVTCVSIGCDSAPFPLAQVEGQVTLDGKPLSNAKVMFAPVAAAGEIEAGKAAFGLLDSEGRFTLSTYKQDDGAVVGEHWVTVVNLAEGKGQRFSRVTVPTGRFRVEQGEINDIVVELTSAMLKGQTDSE